jgi:predicted nucleic acid-binding protein
MPRTTRVTQRSLLIDTNIVLDLILGREPWALDAARLLDAISRGAARGFLAGHAVSTVHYLVEKAADRATANTAIADILQLVVVVPLDGADFQRALALGMRDYEDAVQVSAALRIGADFIVTRNSKDFSGSPIAVRTPSEILALLHVTPSDG